MRQVVVAGVFVAVCSLSVAGRVRADTAALAPPARPRLVTPPQAWPVAPLSAADRALALTTIVKPSGVAAVARPAASPPNPLRARFEVAWGTFFTSSAKFKPHIQDALSVTPSWAWVHKGLVGFSVPAGGKWFIDCSINDSLAHAAPPPPAATVATTPPSYPPFTVFWGGSGANEGVQHVYSHNDHLAFTIAPPLVDPSPAGNPTGEILVHIWRNEGGWTWANCKAEPVD